MFLQISNSSAILIFNARTQGFSFLSKPAIQLFLSAVVSQLFVNALLLCSGGFIVEQLNPKDVALIWAYDLLWLVVIDLVKMAIIYIQDGSTGGASVVPRRSGGVSVSKDLRISLNGTPMP